MADLRTRAQEAGVVLALWNAGVVLHTALFDRLPRIGGALLYLVLPLAGLAAASVWWRSRGGGTGIQRRLLVAALLLPLAQLWFESHGWVRDWFWLHTGDVLQQPTAHAPPEGGYHFVELEQAVLLGQLAEPELLERRTHRHGAQDAEHTTLTHAAPIVPAGWQRGQPVAFWAVSDHDEPSWHELPPLHSPLRGMVVPHPGVFQPAVDNAMEQHELVSAGGALLLQLVDEPLSAAQARARNDALLGLLGLDVLALLGLGLAWRLKVGEERA